MWCPRADSNHRHSDFQSLALPTELLGLTGSARGADPVRKRRYRRGACCLSSIKIAVLVRLFSPPDRPRIHWKNDRPAGREKPLGQVFYSHRPAIAADRDPCIRRCKKAPIVRIPDCRRRGISGALIQPSAIPAPEGPETDRTAGSRKSLPDRASAPGKAMRDEDCRPAHFRCQSTGDPQPSR